ncbi:hypothetical protein BE1S18E01_02280 [Acinetobacter sp. BEC1-S18-ESBL-01]|jgi:hypothetical protein|uniref:hypothetical protein n=1 Tax=Acinetobacter TaxID=469 RepID=UPI0002CDAB8A|nr:MULTISPECIES: hypothetical protein [Acinetobacter]AMO39441.1 hypothetical protein A0J50_01050 [Acinetobacter sp. DUT-2]ENW13232.1 hypothetical protein F930_00790 [Acinetobacter pittii ANC 3678]EXH35515.1 hypothetical protein J623_0668 [Acinetobacter sp. 1245249]EYT28588.1 hypothetical protein J622_00574 [Acinetobacter sp. 1564232]MCU4470313.1 hypothetical protein [Acinetobacter pittii]
MFINTLSSLLEKLASKENLDEWYLSTFIDENVCSLLPPEAFKFSSHVIKLLKNDAQPDYTYELLTILLALQRQSDTTQAPEILKNSPNFFDEFIKKKPEKYILNLAYELAQNYRIKL